ncbi:MAG: protein kinase [Gemmatimonadota bacterium]
MTETISCTSCGHDFAKGDRFCPQCGAEAPMDTSAADQLETAAMTSVPIPCPSCGAPLASTDRFCSKCGAARDQDATVVMTGGAKNAQATQLATATTGEFEVMQQLGLGAMGSVYLARDVALSRKVAIKVIASNLLQDEAMVSRFRLEAQTVASLRHPNIVNVHAVREEDSLHYFVMDFIDGPPLRSIVKTHAPLEVPVVQALLYQVGSALDYAHHRGKGVIHRDIKPANIMVDREGDAFVTDFGISKITESQTGLTQTGATIGTPEYMSPEQCRGEELTGASDQYALGVVAYEMLVGHTPFSGSQYFIMVAHTSEEPKPILELRPDCPTHVAEAVHRMLAKDPTDRYPDLESAMAAMGGAPLGRRDPIRQHITRLAGSTAEVKALDTASPLSPLPGRAAPDTATSVTVLGLPTRIEEGDTFRLSADVRGTTQGSIPGANVVWTSTDPSVAVVENGEVRALKAGSAVISAAVGGITNSVSIVVGHAAPAAVSIEPGTVHVASGQKAALAAAVRDKHGRELDRAVRWLTSDASVASVSSTGEVVATGMGSAVVTAESGGVTGTAEIIVQGTGAHIPVALQPDSERPPLYRRPAALAALLVLLLGGGAAGGMSMGIIPGIGPFAPAEEAAGPALASPITAIAIDMPADSLRVGDEHQLVFEAIDESGAPVDGDLEWESSDPAIASVDPGGLLTVLAEGPVTITASAGDLVERVTLLVTPATEETVAEAPPEEPEAEAARPTPPPANRPTPRRNTQPAFNPEVTSLELTGMPSTMRVGETATFGVRVLDQRGTAMGGQVDRVRWRTADPNVVRLGEGDFFVAVGPGTTIFTASIGELRAEQAVTVEAAVQRIELEPASLALRAGESANLRTRVVGPNNFELPEELIVWNTDAPTVADVRSGQVTGIGPGTAVITATADGVVQSLRVSVTRAPATAADARRLVLEYVALLSAADAVPITQLYDASTSDQLDDLLDIVDNREFTPTFIETEAEGGYPIDFANEGDLGRAGFRLQLLYRTRFGGERITLRDFEMFIGPADGGGWRIVSVVMLDD